MIEINEQNLINIGGIFSIGIIFIILVKNNKNNKDVPDFVGIKITIKCGHSVWDEQIICIQSNDPWTLYKENENCSINFIKKYVATKDVFDVIKVEVFENKNKLQDTFLFYKIANYIGLDAEKVKTHEGLTTLIDNHIKYSPPKENTGYVSTYESWKKRITN